MAYNTQYTPIGSPEIRSTPENSNRQASRPLHTPRQYQPAFSDSSIPQQNTAYHSSSYLLNPSSGSQDNVPYNPIPGQATTLPYQSPSAYSAKPTLIQPKKSSISHFGLPRAAAPWEHELSEKDLQSNPVQSDTVRAFKSNKQRRRMFVDSSFQLLVTILICGLLAGTMYGFSTIDTGLSKKMKRVFNALITGLSISLGINLGSSLVGYAQMMRWRLLSLQYRTLQDFELIMSCDSLSKVVRLLWAGRTRGRLFPSKLQIIALSWLCLNIAFQVAVALLGLNYNLDISETTKHLVIGNLSTVDTSSIWSSVNGYEGVGQQITANEFGIMGQSYVNVTGSLDNDSTGAYKTYYQNEDMTLYWHRFIDHSATKFADAIVTRRTITTKVACTAFEVVAGGYAGFDGQAIDYVSIYDIDGKIQRMFVGDSATGATTWVSTPNERDCGPRCTQLWALQAADNM